MRRKDGSETRLHVAHLVELLVPILERRQRALYIVIYPVEHGALFDDENRQLFKEFSEIIDRFHNAIADD